MDLEQSILAEHSKAQCMRITAYIGNDRERFAQLMKLFLNGEYRVTQRAAWPLSCCVEAYPELIKPWYAQLLRKLQEPDTHNAVTRNIVRSLQYVTIPEKYQGTVMSICFDFIADPNQAAAVKAFSLSILQNLAKDYPEIAPELITIIEGRWSQETPAFQSRARKLLKFLKR
ncbi:hypothetical protein [Pseudoflavitalea rhizosphaerae]|uniref:hypothetical protein n=1 Tax=Pseudoflavitalea rhizosphaerae TaxID=1884793 RepID=UPI000F8F53D9|nr:hypothetical protein [Pseudoflavitalea rhizosphaerae]